MFALRGFSASVREIAAHAGVTAGLITHHFGSKDSLRAECDVEVLRQYRAVKSDGIAMSPTQSIAMLADVEDYIPIFIYTLRSVRDGGAAGAEFLEHMIQETIEFTAEGVEAGVVRPSRNPEARARYMVTSSLGGLLLQLPLPTPLNFADVGPAVRKIVNDITLPTLELYTEGVLVDRRFLDEYLLYIGDPPGDAHASAHQTPQP